MCLYICSKIKEKKFMSKASMVNNVQYALVYKLKLLCNLNGKYQGIMCEKILVYITYILYLYVYRC